ncbi:type II toxin-antitoxin system RelE/ParE family toxin [Rhodoblastus sp.]|uniref:type II toxin-antitoxin system RelE/ParE family toxin n=1 Tax=Rhodoblastus sp. TaxID=1962975 RepID=UPI003F95CD77
MIASFKSKALRLFWLKNDASGIKPEWAKRVRIVLNMLDVANDPAELDVPGLGWHPLTGNRRGQYAVSVSRNWRITFGFMDGDAQHVNLEDYHG